MVTRVYNDRGELLHDCGELGCTVSWDGYILNPGVYRSQLDANSTEIPEGTNIAEGEPALNRSDVDADVWDVRGGSAYLRKQ